MATIDLPEVLRQIGEQVVDSARAVAASVALPQEIREKAIGWAAGTAAALAAAGVAKVQEDQDAYDAAMREVRLFGEAAKAVAVGEAMIGIAAAEAEARKSLAAIFDMAISIGTKLLVAAL